MSGVNQGTHYVSRGKRATVAKAIVASSGAVVPRNYRLPLQSGDIGLSARVDWGSIRKMTSEQRIAAQAVAREVSSEILAAVGLVETDPLPSGTVVVVTSVDYVINRNSVPLQDCVAGVVVKYTETGIHLERFDEQNRVCKTFKPLAGYEVNEVPDCRGIIGLAMHELERGVQRPGLIAYVPVEKLKQVALAKAVHPSVVAAIAKTTTDEDTLLAIAVSQTLGRVSTIRSAQITAASRLQSYAALSQVIQNTELCVEVRQKAFEQLLDQSVLNEPSLWAFAKKLEDGKYSQSKGFSLDCLRKAAASLRSSALIFDAIVTISQRDLYEDAGALRKKLSRKEKIWLIKKLDDVAPNSSALVGLMNAFDYANDRAAIEEALLTGLSSKTRGRLVERLERN